MARRNPAEIVTGAAVLLIAGGFLAYALANTGQSGGAGYPLRAAFDHIDGINPGSDVRIAGVKVGSVLSTALDPKSFLADVTFTVQNGIKLPTDSSATVTTDGLLGSKYLALQPGGSDKMLGPNGEITITQGSISIESLIGKYIFGKSPSNSGSPGQTGGSTGSSGSGSGGVPPLQ